MGRKQPRLASINSIFEVKNNDYTKKAELYQAILKYACEEQGFTLRDLGKNLHTKTSITFSIRKNRSKNIDFHAFMDNRGQTLEAYVKRLCLMRLLKNLAERQAKKDPSLKVQYFQSTRSAELIYALTKCLTPKRLERPDPETFYGILINYLKSYDSAELRLAALFYKKCRRSGLFPFVLDILAVLVDSRTSELQFDNALDLMLYLPSWKIIEPGIPGEEQNTNKCLTKLKPPLVQSIKALDSKSKKTYLRVLKYWLEWKVIESHPLPDFEELWVKHSADASKFVGYGLCKKCKYSYPVAYDILEYIVSFANLKFPITDCCFCGCKRTVLVTHFLYRPTYRSQMAKGPA